MVEAFISGFEVPLAMQVSEKLITREVGPYYDGDNEITYQYDAQGDIISGNYINDDGSTSPYGTMTPTYDANGRLSSVSANLLVGGDNYAVLYDSVITYDDLGRISAVNQTWKIPQTGLDEKMDFVFLYDGKNRLKTYSHSSSTDIGQSQSVTNLTYNRHGQPLKMTATIRESDAGGRDVTYTLNGKWSYKKDLTLTKYTDQTSLGYARTITFR
ncbi:MAG: hypothetical protein PUE64_06515 [Firmicutes bacterium]|nr:hypothetical protein [Bacillota bacterium]